MGRPYRVPLVLLLVVTGAACSGSAAPTPTPSPGPGPLPVGSPARVLMLTTTAGFRHDSIDAARDAMTTLASATRAFTVTTTEDLSTLSTTGLASYDVLFFALTSGELALSDAQKAAVLGFVNSGNGFLGVHSATDTLYAWPEYGALVGAYFREHPWTQRATVLVENTAHPATEGLGTQFTLTEEFYTFQENPRPRVQVLLRLDAASVGTTGDYPLAWVKTSGSGRVYYNALGHFADTWRDPRFQQQLTGSIRWLCQRC